MASRYFVANGHTETMVLVLEPWGTELRMPPGFRVEVVAEGPPGDLEIEHGDHRIVLYGWEGSVLYALVDGAKI